MGISNAFDPPAPSSLGVPVYTTVQAGLFNRLRKTHGDRAGDLAWLLVRTAQPDHREHDDAFAALATQPMPALVALSSVVGAARAAAKTAPARDMLDAITVAIETAQATAHLRAAK